MPVSITAVVPGVIYELYRKRQNEFNICLEFMLFPNYFFFINYNINVDIYDIFEEDWSCLGLYIWHIQLIVQCPSSHLKMCVLVVSALYMYTCSLVETEGWNWLYNKMRSCDTQLETLVIL